MVTMKIWQYNGQDGPFKRVFYNGGLWHSSRTKQIANNGSQISKFHFPASQKVLEESKIMKG